MGIYSCSYLADPQNEPLNGWPEDEDAAQEDPPAQYEYQFSWRLKDGSMSHFVTCSEDMAKWYRKQARYEVRIVEITHVYDRGTK
jgi:hypothetical protein